MTGLREVRASGRDALLLAGELLQRARRAGGQTGLWDAADVQWWWSRPRRSDTIEKSFWADDEGPVAGVLLTSWTDERWQCDPIIVPGAPAPDPEAVWAQAQDDVEAHAVGRLEVPVGGGDLRFKELVESSGLVAGERSHTAWIASADRPAPAPLADGFALVDRTERRGSPHPMRKRNGDLVEQRLRECPLYDAELDLAVETSDGRCAGYSLYWFDPVTKSGLVEPVRVEDEFQRRGLARAMLTAGLERLGARGAQRIKIGFESDAAGALYQSIGFEPTSADTWYEKDLD